jgi:hypothetical protein
VDDENNSGDDDAQVDAAETPLRKTRARGPRIIARRYLRKEVHEEARSSVYPTDRGERPTVRSQCAGGERPCPWVSCRYHLYLSVNPESGAITINFPNQEPWDLKETCALDVAERGGITLEEVGELMNLTRERVRQLEVKGLRLLRHSRNARDLTGDD